MRDSESYYSIKALRDKLEKEGVESIYQFIKKCKLTSGSSKYSALINDLIGCCPSSDEWCYPRIREEFRYDVKYYCDYYLVPDEDD